MQSLTMEMSLLRTAVKKKDSDAPTQKSSDSALTKNMAQIMSIDDAKKGEIMEKEGPVTALTEAPAANSRKVVAIEPTLEAIAEVDLASAIVQVQSVVPVRSLPMLPPLQNVPIPSVPVQSGTTFDALILTHRETPTIEAAKAKKLRLQNLAAKRKDEEQKKKEAEIAKDKTRGMVEAKAVPYFENQVALLNQLYKNELMPITKDEYQVCLLQGRFMLVI